jgi:hypothetical protein
LLQWVAVVLLVLAVAIALSLGLLFLRRIVLQRDGGFDMCIRSGSPNGWAGGWVFGIGRYQADDLEWYRTFSLSMRPKRSLCRGCIEVRRRREPTSEEAYELPADHVVLDCLIDEDPADITMNDPATTAFLAWLEAAPPGGHLVA